MFRTPEQRGKNFAYIYIYSESILSTFETMHRVLGVAHSNCGRSPRRWSHRVQLSHL